MSDCPFDHKIAENDEITIWVPENYDLDYAPVKGERHKEWWERDGKAKDHARFCLPLTMASSLGYYILSPATFEVTWDGNLKRDAKVEIYDKCSHAEVDAHSTHGGFTVQANFIVRTKNPGDFVMVTDLMNADRRPFYAMSGCIEGWWNAARFGVVCIINQPGSFVIRKGEPIAQMFLLKESGAQADLRIKRGILEETTEFNMKRARRGKYKDVCPVHKGKDLDYMRGLHPDGTPVDHHVKAWKTNIIVDDDKE